MILLFEYCFCNHDGPAVNFPSLLRGLKRPSDDRIPFLSEFCIRFITKVQVEQKEPRSLDLKPTTNQRSYTESLPKSRYAGNRS